MGLAQAPPQRAGLDLVPTRVGGESSLNRIHPFTTGLSQYGSTEPFRPVQMEVSTSTTVVEQAQAGLRQGFRWLGWGQASFKLILAGAITVATKDVPARSRSVDWERSGTTEVLDAPFFVGRTVTERYGPVILARRSNCIS